MQLFWCLLTISSNNIDDNRKDHIIKSKYVTLQCYNKESKKLHSKLVSSNFNIPEFNKNSLQFLKKDITFTLVRLYSLEHRSGSSSDPSLQSSSLSHKKDIGIHCLFAQVNCFVSHVDEPSEKKKRNYFYWQVIFISSSDVGFIYDKYHIWKSELII